MEYPIICILPNNLAKPDHTVRRPTKARQKIIIPSTKKKYMNKRGILVLVHRENLYMNFNWAFL